MTFRKNNIYNKVRVYNKVYGKEIVDKKHKLLKLCLEQSLK